MNLPDPLYDALAERYADPPPRCAAASANAALRRIAARASCRDFADRPPPADLVDTLCAVALAAPSKSDLQQRDIVVLYSRAQRQRIGALLPEHPWIAAAPLLLVFCANNRRQRQIAVWRDKPFANDHLDAFFNASVDAAIALGTFVTAAEAAGLGCCPLSVIRNHAARVSEILALPGHVFPVAGLALGWPRRRAEISLRLPLAATVHRDTFSDADVRRRIDDYDRRRAARQPYARQRATERFGEAADYGWSEEKARHYAVPERADFGAFVRAKGFRLD